MSATSCASIGSWAGSGTARAVEWAGPPCRPTRSPVPRRGQENRSCRTVRNSTRGSRFDPSDIAWQRVGFETGLPTAKHEARSHLATALRRHLADRERQEEEARLVEVGPYLVDFERIVSCPCCLQSIPPVLLARFRTALANRQPWPPARPALIGLLGRPEEREVH